ncbi:DUF3885 domain-containing protein [Pseudomonas moraviensis]|uniref:DUF3885 domain-containing protein n=1 Tax=Pseudomonas TaxID=286 RepID=UPI000F06C261|nr:DUF3885 domain-containing protein [Pseudomonas moraviensis]MXI48371.1 DUF3885 domain-containing protein [Pseudomonas moraviensis]
MNLRAEIENAFGPQAFARPLFYSWPGGLRFELSETGGMIEQFLTAMRKSITICGDIFQGDASFVACLRIHSGRNRFAHRSTLRALKSAGIDTPSALCIWSEEIDNEEWLTEEEPEYWVNVAFEASVASIQALLWCALAKDFGAIQPRANCAVYLFNLPKRVMVFPYDDRGMDVVGANTELLLQLYQRHQVWLLDHDRVAMEATFGRLKR